MPRAYEFSEDMQKSLREAFAKAVPDLSFDVLETNLLPDMICDLAGEKEFRNCHYAENNDASVGRGHLIPFYFSSINEEECRRMCANLNKVFEKQIATFKFTSSLAIAIDLKLFSTKLSHKHKLSLQNTQNGSQNMLFPMEKPRYKRMILCSDTPQKKL